MAGDIRLDEVWMSERPQHVRVVDQAYDFSTAELTTRLNFRAGGRQTKIVVVSFCSRERPTVVCQEIAIEVDAASDLKVRVRIDLSGIEGRALRYKAWPVLSGVAEWIKSRVTKRRGKYEIHASIGIAERSSPSDNAVFTNMSARTILLDAISAARRLNRPVDPAWLEIATRMVIPK